MNGAPGLLWLVEGGKSNSRSPAGMTNKKARTTAAVAVLSVFFDDGFGVLGVLGPGAVVEGYVGCSGDFEA